MNLKFSIYAVAVGCFAFAGTLDIMGCRYKEGLIAWLFAACNAIIFFWR